MVSGDNNTARPGDRIALVFVFVILIVGIFVGAKACGANYDCKRSGGTVTHPEHDGGIILCVYPSGTPSPIGE